MFFLNGQFISAYLGYIFKAILCRTTNTQSKYLINTNLNSKTQH